MQAFADLLNALLYTQSRNRKIAIMAAYFSATPDPDRGWALAALTDGLPLNLPFRRLLSELLAGRIDPVLYALSRDFVGDTAETVSLLWRGVDHDRSLSAPPNITQIVEQLSAIKGAAAAPLLESYLDRLDASGRWALLKLIGGAPRVGVSSRLAKTALASTFGADVADVEEVWHSIDPPYAELFAWLEGKGPRPDPGNRPVFRPLMLAHPIEEADWPGLAPSDVVAEWKWDGIRVQVAAKGAEMRLFSRTGDDISKSFPEIASAFIGHDCVLDGELLVLRNGTVAPFNDLQQRLNRKTVSSRMLREYPAHIRLYDLLFDGRVDLRSADFNERRTRLENWHGKNAPARTDLSDLVAFTDFAELRAIWQATREEGIEGLMLKRRSGPYLAGRPKGHWWKWKRAPLTLDCVMMYAQRGSGKRSSLYSDYTFGVWRGPETEGGPPELVPVGKAYSGFTDEELKRLDKFIRANTTQRFGPVRAVKPELVLEVAFDAVQRSPRHKSGIAMRFPRIARIRWDKPASEADTLASVEALLSTT